MSQKILIIEDEANILYALQAKFSVAGYRVKTLADGTLEEIINKIKLYGPDYIILDMILPQVHGSKILAEVKADQEIANIPVFVFTDLSRADGKTRGLDLGAEQYFIKNDFRIDDFVARVIKIINNKEKLNKKYAENKKKI